MRFFRRTQSGFTLIELLVVVGIISLLASIVLAATNSAKQRAHDGALMLTMRELQTALEFYRDRFGEYPSTSGGGVDVFDIAGSTDFVNALAPVATYGFLAEIPHHPDWPDNVDYTVKGFLEYETDAALYPGTLDPFTCGGVPKPSGGYVLLVNNPRELNLPKFGHLHPDGSVTDEVHTFTGSNFYYCIVSQRGGN